MNASKSEPTTRQTPTDGTAKLIRVEGGAGNCDDCSTAITLRRFIIEFPDGSRRTLGRRCAMRATGWSRARLEGALTEEARLARDAEHASRRERLLAAYPVLATVPDALVWDIVTSDSHWREGQDWRWQRFAENRVETVEERRNGRRI